MKKEKDRRVYVDVNNRENIFALLENNKLVEFRREQRYKRCKVEDIFLGRITRIDDGLNAAFVDIGLSKDAFLPCREIGETFFSVQAYLENQFSSKESEKKVFPNISLPNKDVKIKDLLQIGQYIIVQIEKEEISTKGASVSTNLSLVGRMLVFVPFGKNKVSVSKKIKDPYERGNLQSLFQAIKEKDCQIVVRTHAKNGQTADAHRELTLLSSAWKEAIGNVKRLKPQRIYKAHNMILSFLREFIDETYTSIVINDKSLWRKINDYVANLYIINRQKIEIIYWNRKIPLFDKFGITHQIISSFSRILDCGEGASLEFHSAEGMCVININLTSSENILFRDQDAYTINMKVAQDVVSQIRLRDIGGIIAIRFLPLYTLSFQKNLYEKIKTLMASDRHTHELAPFREFQRFTVMEITRQRVRSPMSVETDSFCSCCNGSGRNTKFSKEHFLIEEIEEILKEIKQQKKVDQLYLYLHPYVSAYLKKKKNYFSFSQVYKWKKKYIRSLKVYEDQSFSMFKYEFCDRGGNFHYNNDKSIKKKNNEISMQFTIPCRGKSYLVIDLTSKVCVIDVNSGPSSAKLPNTNLQLDTNMAVIPKIAEIIKKIDYEGIIAIDFIDIYSKNDKDAITQAMREALKNDNAEIAPLGDFCVMQINRKSILGKNINKQNYLQDEIKDPCLCCHGSGRALPSMLIPYEIEAKLENILTHRTYNKVKLYAHPYLSAFLSRGKNSKLSIWRRKYNQKIFIVPTNNLPLLRYIFRDENNRDIDIL